jgi:hypothetical protein
MMPSLMPRPAPGLLLKQDCTDIPEGYNSLLILPKPNFYIYITDHFNHALNIEIEWYASFPLPGWAVSLS